MCVRVCMSSSVVVCWCVYRITDIPVAKTAADVTQAHAYITQEQSYAAKSSKKEARKSGVGTEWEDGASGINFDQDQEGITISKLSSVVAGPATVAQPKTQATAASSGAAAHNVAAEFRFDYTKDRTYKGNIRHTPYEQLPPELKRHITPNEWQSLRKSIGPRPWVAMVLIMLIAPIPFLPLYCSRACKAGCEDANARLVGKARFKAINGSTVEITVRDIGGLTAA